MGLALIPGSLEHLTGWQLGNIKLLVGVADVSIASNHLVVDDCKDSLETEDVAADDETLEHVDLSALDFVVTVLFVPQSCSS